MATILGFNSHKKDGQLIGLNVAEVMFSTPWSLVSRKCDTRIDLFVQVLTTVAIVIATLGIALIGIFIQACINENNRLHFPSYQLYDDPIVLAKKKLDEIPAARKAEAIDKLSKINLRVSKEDESDQWREVNSMCEKVLEATVPIIVEEMLKKRLTKARMYSPGFDQKSPLSISKSIIEVSVKSYFEEMGNSRWWLWENSMLRMLEKPSSGFSIVSILDKLRSGTSFFDPTCEEEESPIEAFREELLKKGPLYRNFRQVYLPEMDSFLTTINFDQICKLIIPIIEQKSASIYKSNSRYPGNDKRIFENELSALIFKKFYDAHFMKISVLQKIWEQKEAVDLVGQEIVDYYKELYAYPGAERMLKEEQEESDQKLLKYMPRGITLKKIEEIVALALQEQTSSV